MPYSYEKYKELTAQQIAIYLERINARRIIDVGAGCGTYAALLRPMFGGFIDAIEIHKPYIKKFGLKALYDNIFLTDARTFDYREYDYVIMGDILEHLTETDARKLLDKIRDIPAMVAVPYEMPQGEYEGNKYEIHLQADLTPDIFRARYPEFELGIGDAQYGYYYKHNK